MPEGTTSAQIYAGVNAYEKSLPVEKRKDVQHPLPPGFRSGWERRRDFRFSSYAAHGNWD